jgi:hypothetical protein
VRHEELPSKTPVPKTSAPPRLTWSAAETTGVSMERWRIHVITANSTTYDAHPAPYTIVYGVALFGFVERVPARSLDPGCYEVHTSGCRIAPLMGPPVRPVRPARARH